MKREQQEQVCRRKRYIYHLHGGGGGGGGGGGSDGGSCGGGCDGPLVTMAGCGNVQCSEKLSQHSDGIMILRI